MDDLRRLFHALGHADAETYLQSGNVVFSAPGAAAPRLAGEIERGLTRELGLDVRVLLRTADDLERVVAGNPFLGRGADPSALHVTFLSEAPAPERAARLAAPEGEPAEFVLAGREVYLRCPDGYGRTKLNNAYFERRLALPATTRNWNTTVKLRALMDARGEGHSGRGSGPRERHATTG
jgi:uncharacterized protein (DUF1697 family)